jgi:hypothetical protein
MINNINSYFTNFNLNSATTSSSEEIDKIIEEHKTSKTSTNETASSIKENLYLSSRAQKIDTISTEFFNNGVISFNDVDALKERAYQLGLISKQEYSHLTDTELAESDSQLNTNISSQTLASFADNLLQRLDEISNGDSGEDSDTKEISNSLIAFKEALITAKDILSDIDSAKDAPDFKKSLASALSLIKETINADSFEIIPLDDKVGISKIYQSLDIVDKIIPERLSNEKVNRYIEISFA